MTDTTKTSPGARAREVLEELDDEPLTITQRIAVAQAWATLGLVEEARGITHAIADAGADVVEDVCGELEKLRQAMPS